MLDDYDLNEMDKAFADFRHDLDEFLAESLPNRYVYGNDIISVYVRKGHHYLDGALTKCLDIGTIVISDHYRGNGLGIRVIDYMHQINPFRATFVESLLNNRLHDRLLSEHWRSVPNANPPSVYKYKSE